MLLTNSLNQAEQNPIPFSESSNEIGAAVSEINTDKQKKFKSSSCYNSL